MLVWIGAEPWQCKRKIDATMLPLRVFAIQPTPGLLRTVRFRAPICASSNWSAPLNSDRASGMNGLRVPSTFMLRLTVTGAPRLPAAFVEASAHKNRLSRNRQGVCDRADR